MTRNQMQVSRWESGQVGKWAGGKVSWWKSHFLTFTPAHLLTCLALACWPAHAQLTVRVTPGKTFRENERPTTATLNQLGKPTIEVFGTVGGTNVSLGTNSVLGSHLSDSVVDNITIEFNDAVPRAIRVKAYSIGTNVVSTNLAGTALTGGGGLPLSVLYDTNLFGLDTNAALTLKTNLDLTLLSLNLTNAYIFLGDTNNHATQVPLSTNVFGFNTNGQFSLLAFTSFEYPLRDGVVCETNHGLPATPTLTRWVLVSKTNQFGYQIGDELTISDGSDHTDKRNFQQGCSSSNVYLVFNASSTLILLNKTNGNEVNSTTNFWRAKVYARP